MVSLDVRIVRSINGTESTVARDAALEFFLCLLRDGAFERIGATAEENRAGDAESDREGLQALRILKKVMSDK